MKPNLPSVKSSNEDDVVIESAAASRRSSTQMNFLLGLSLLVVLVVGTLLILDSLIPLCTSSFRPCKTNGTTWFATKNKFTREESINFCISGGYKTASISIAGEIFAENRDFFGNFGNFWIIEEEYVRPKTFHLNKSSILTTPRQVTAFLRIKYSFALRVPHSIWP